MWNQVGVLISNLSIKHDLRERIRHTQWSDAKFQANEGISSFARAPDGFILFK